MAKAHLRCCEDMNAFFYGFGLALALAITLAVGNAWVREHRNGVWTVPMIVGVVAIALVLGTAIGWAFVQYFAFYNAAATSRM
jgi:Na+-translocating ferredoxin:NAD+ oxidoreductase RnfA subunit